MRPSGRASLWLAVLPLVALAYAAYAGEDAAPKPPSRVRLALAPAPGAPVRFVHSVVRQERVRRDGGGQGLPANLRDQTKSIEVETEFSLEILEQRPNGSHDVVLRFGRTTATLTHPGRKPVEARSDRPVPEDATFRTEAAEAVARGDIELRGSLDGDGMVAAFTVPEPLPFLRRERLGLRPHEMGRVLMPLREDVVVAWVRRALMSTPLPKAEVGVGATWSLDLPIESEAGDSGFVLRQTMRVAAIGDGEVRIEGKGKGVLTPGKVPLDPFGKAELRESTADSMVRLSSQDGLPVEGSIEFSFTLATRGRSSLASSTRRCSERHQIRRVEKWPSSSGEDGAAPPEGR